MDIAIDLGSDRTRVFIEGKGKVLDEASVITYDVDSEQIYAVGDEAYNMIGKHLLASRLYIRLTAV